MARLSFPLLLCACSSLAACFSFGDDSRSVPVGSAAGGTSSSGGFTQPREKPGRPVFGSPVSQSVAPPPISGGTLLVARDGTIVAADPDRDVVSLVSPTAAVRAQIALTRGDEPGRAVEDAAGRVHVVLRGAGALATIDLASGALVARRAVCAEPRGVTIEPVSSKVWVACLGGDLVRLPADPASAEPVTRTRVADDLRDIVLAGSVVYVTRYRSAELLELDAATLEVLRKRPAPSARAFGRRPSLAWRMIASPDASSPEPIVVHQSARASAIPAVPGAYGGSRESSTSGCDSGSVVEGEISRYGAEVVRLPKEIVLPVDLAHDGTSLYVVAAGNGHTPGRARVVQLSGQLPRLGEDGKPAPGATTCAPVTALLDDGEPVAVAARGRGRVVVQLREPSQLVFLPEGARVDLGGESRRDTGHAIFHADSGVGIACASCHGEGGDDALVWTVGAESRRTPSMRGTIAGTAPFHLSGDVRDMHALMQSVYTSRMDGPPLSVAQTQVVDAWLSALPAPRAPTPADGAAADRGAALFTGKGGCADCHAGPMATRSGREDVGTGGDFEIPSLKGVGARLPVMHTGCAASLEESLDPSCAGVRHVPPGLTLREARDLAAYLGTL